MIKSILVPIDGSDNSGIATDYALYLANTFDAELTGLNVIDVRALEGPFLSDISGSLGFSPFQNYLPKFQEILENRGDVVLDQFRSHCLKKGIEPKTKRMTGIVPGVIAEEAKKVDLIIIAQRGEHERWSTGLLGSTTESVIRKAPRPVLVTPNSFSMIQKILIAYDGGMESNKALKTACDIFSSFGAVFSIVFVTDTADAADELASEVKEFLDPYNITYSSDILSGQPAQAIMSYCNEGGFDLIVMGAFSHSRIHELILGGTTAYIIRQSTVPVLLYR